jgi:DNA-binding transcriptional ArsR family regulator
MKILLFLSRQELCVHDLTAMLDMSQSAVSHQLAELREHGLVSKRKEGRVVYYSLSDERDLHGVREILDQLQ